MKPIQKNELFQHLSGFLKTKGIEMTEGSYSQGIQKSCSLLTEAINLSQKSITRAKDGIDTKLEQMRQVIHEKTAPKPPRASAAAAAAPKPSPGKASAGRKKPGTAGTKAKTQARKAKR